MNFYYKGDKEYEFLLYPLSLLSNRDDCSISGLLHIQRGQNQLLASIQDEKSHKKFIEKNELPFPLIADTDLKLVETFGVYGEKKMYGRTYMGTFRTTFIINEDGIIERILGPKQIKTKDHAAQILAED